MSEEGDLQRRIAGCAPGALAALADELEAEARAPYRAGVSLIGDSLGDGAGRELLGRAMEHAAAAVADESRPASPQDTVWLLQAAVAGEVSLRQRLAGWLGDRLADRRLLPPPPQGPIADEQPLPERVCDVAFAALRDLHHWGEEPTRRLVDGDVFLGLTDAERDAVIAEATRLGAYRPRLADVPLQDDEP